MSGFDNLSQSAQTAYDAGVAAERERCAQFADDQADLADSQALTRQALIAGAVLRKFAALLRKGP